MDAELEAYLQKIYRPEIFGPGKWDDMHVKGLYAKTYTEKLAYIRDVEIILNTLRCTCKEDALEYLKTHPLTDYWDITEHGEDIGMFYWSVDFHNWVNKKLGKPHVPRDIAYRFYRHPEEFVCKEGCGDKQPPLASSAPRSLKPIFLPL